MKSPDIDEVRRRAQPADVLSRRNAEHWMSWVWARRASPYVTRRMIAMPFSANQITAMMIVVGLGGAAVLALPGLTGALICVVLIELYLLLDCVDGEVARWRQTTSIKGKYLDRIGHYVVEAALLAMYGVHAAESWRSPWVSVSTATALLAILTKASTDLQFSSGADWRDRDESAIVTPRSVGLQKARVVTQAFKVHRLTGAVEASLLMVVAAVAKSAGFDEAEFVLVVIFAAISVLLFPAHLLSILTSNRLSDTG